ncbi:hypothetical protein BT69DRAFT_1353479 [Atractiella rhizophila]|nr:hypothetical protein BT69DRAFT_1353479 [Atractiella rhizophila]
MAPHSLSESLVPLSTKSLPQDQSATNFVQSYTLDRHWAFGSVPQGGYLLGLILNTCLNFIGSQPELRDKYRDPLVLTSHFLRRSEAGSRVEVAVEVVHRTKKMLWLNGSLSYDGKPNIHTTHIFTLHPPLSSFPLPAPSPPLPTYSPPCPIGIHPSHPSVRDFQLLPWYKRTDVKVLEIPKEHLQRSLTENGEWGAFVDFGEPVTVASLPFLVDTFKNLAELIVDQPPSWYPTLALQIEFPFPLPPQSPSTSTSLSTSSTTTITSTSTGGTTAKIALYASSRVILEGRSDTTVEVWIIPHVEGEELAQDGQGWRERSVLVAVGRQSNAIMTSQRIKESKAKNVEKSKL